MSRRRGRPSPARSRPSCAGVAVARARPRSATTSSPAPTSAAPQRLVLAGHTDTVPANGNERARIDGDRLRGLGSADMKGGLAVMLELARTVDEPAVDVTYVFYAGEEVAAERQRPARAVQRAARPAGRRRRPARRADLGAASRPAARAPCACGSRSRGERAHTARPWMGRNADPSRCAGCSTPSRPAEERQPVHRGLSSSARPCRRCASRAAWPATSCPTGPSSLVNHRFAPDRTPAEAEAHVREVGRRRSTSTTATPSRSSTRPPGPRPASTTRCWPRSSTATASTSAPSWAGPTSPGSPRIGVPAANFGPGDASSPTPPASACTRADLEACTGPLDDLLPAWASIRPRLRRLAATTVAEPPVPDPAEEHRWPSRSDRPPRTSR